jgi:hypothetical protein
MLNAGIMKANNNASHTGQAEPHPLEGLRLQTIFNRFVYLPHLLNDILEIGRFIMRMRGEFSSIYTG